MTSPISQQDMNKIIEALEATILRAWNKSAINDLPFDEAEDDLNFWLAIKLKDELDDDKEFLLQNYNSYKNNTELIKSLVPNHVNSYVNDLIGYTEAEKEDKDDRDEKLVKNAPSNDEDYIFTVKNNRKRASDALAKLGVDVKSIDEMADVIAAENLQSGPDQLNSVTGFRTKGEIKSSLNLNDFDIVTTSAIPRYSTLGKFLGYEIRATATIFSDKNRVDSDPPEQEIYKFLEYTEGDIENGEEQPGSYQIKGSTDTQYENAGLESAQFADVWYYSDGQTSPLSVKLGAGGEAVATYTILEGDSKGQVITKDVLERNRANFGPPVAAASVAADPNTVEIKQDANGNWYSYVYNPQGKLVGDPQVLLDEEGDPIVSFAQAQQKALEQYRKDTINQAEEQFEKTHELDLEKFELDKVLGFQAQALDEAQFNVDQLQFNANIAENARQFDEANRLRAFAQQEQARATNIQAGFQINQARSEALDQVRDVLRNPADYLARGFALAGQESPFTPVTQADLINQVTSEYDAYKDFLGSLGAGFNAEEFLAGGQKTGGPLNVVNPDDFYDDGGNGGGGGNNQQSNKNSLLMQRAEQISNGVEPAGGITAADIEFFSKSGFVAPGMPGESQNVNTGFVADFLGNNPLYMTNKDLYTTGGAESFIPGGVYDSSDIRTSGTAGKITKDNPLSQSELDALANLSEANIQTGFGGGLTAEQIAAFRKTGQVPAAEHGGMFGNPVIVGDSSRNKENQELVMSANGAPMVVLPLTDQQVKILEGKRNNNMPKAQTGGMFGFDDFVGFGNRVGNIGFGGTMYNQLPSRTITQRDIIERAERFGTPRVSNVAQGRMPMPMQFGFPLMTPGQLNTLTGDEREELRTRLASRNVSLGDVETAVMQRFGPTGVRRGRRRF